MKILIIDFLHRDVIKNLVKKYGNQIFYKPGMSEQEVLKNIIDVEILVLRTSYTITSHWLEVAQELKLVIVAGNGVNHIPIDELNKRNILLKNIRDASVNSVAEYAICLMLVGLRNISSSIRSIESSKWEKDQLIGNEIYKKTIGLIGLGKIGKTISNLLKNFNVNIVYFDPYETSTDIKKINLLELAEVSDIVCIQVPLLESTKELIDERFLNSMKKDSILINLSRFEVINMRSLVDKLKDKELREVFIDPIEKSQLKDIEKYKDLPITFLPHIGANTHEAQKRIGDSLIEIINKYLGTNYFENEKTEC